ncbi:MAG: hypothetical protein G01um101416_577 [Microgenomates group bacterium Gr01-1014_16]|nr:MAG: hypothetical protein G01um101416_577 [Microgenomates group bacterium Gr01-1014_16]
MKIKKHSYILSKNGFILCVLANIGNYYLGEILYGLLPQKNTSIKYIDGKKFFKYWSIQNKNKKLKGKVGEPTKYDQYYKTVSAIYGSYSYDHTLIGKVFRVEKDEIEKIWIPVNFESLGVKQKPYIEKLSNFLSIDPENIDVAGSNMLDQNILSNNDFDIVLNTKESSQRMVSMIRKLTSDPLYNEEIRPNNIHHRRFILNSVKICSFGSSEDENIFEDSKYTLISQSKKKKARVIDDSESLLSPSKYKILVDNKESYFISYHVGHTALFKKDDFIEFEAPLFDFKIKNKNVSAYVCPIEGTWVAIF